MEDGYKNLVTAFIWIGLFTFIAYSAVFYIAEINGKDTTSFEQNSVNFTKLNNTLVDAQEIGAQEYDAFGGSNGQSANQGGLTFVFNILDFIGIGIIGIGKFMFSFVFGFFNVIFIQIFNNVLHLPPIITGISITVLFMVALLYIWRLARGGS